MDQRRQEQARRDEWDRQHTVTTQDTINTEKRAAETGALTVPAYEDAVVFAGAGSVALEFAKQARFDTLLVAVGGGGLIGGIAAWYAGRTRIIAVEPELSPTLHAALAAGQP